MNAARYHIFSGHNMEDALWLEAVERLDASVERMKNLAGQQPGAYFVFCTRTYSVVASLDTNQSDQHGQAKSA